MAEVYVSDAFGAVHRAHASTAGVADYLPAYCGFLVEKELTALGGAMDDPKRPLVAVLGGAKVADKLAVIENLLKKADTLVIGGGMAFTFLKAKGYETGASLLDEGEDRLLQEHARQGRRVRREAAAAGGRSRCRQVRRGRGEQGRRRGRHSRRLDGSGHRAGDAEALRRGREERRYRYLERPHGRL